MSFRGSDSILTVSALRPRSEVYAVCFGFRFAVLKGLRLKPFCFRFRVWLPVERCIPGNGRIGVQRRDDAEGSSSVFGVLEFYGTIGSTLELPSF